ncbi:unnamed protein product [Arctogadus glacialis]
MLWWGTEKGPECPPDTAVGSPDYERNMMGPRGRRGPLPTSVSGAVWLIILGIPLEDRPGRRQLSVQSPSEGLIQPRSVNNNTQTPLPLPCVEGSHRLKSSSPERAGGGGASPANVFMLHLAVADLCYVSVLPLRAAYHLTGGHWPFGGVPRGGLPLLRQHARRARSAHVASLLLWAMVAVSMAPLLLSRQTAEVDGVTVCRQLYREKASRRALVSLGVAFTPPFLFTLACYLLIVRSLRRGSRLDPALKSKALRTIGLVMLIYVLCFLPYHVSRATFILGYARPGVGCGARRALSLANRLTSALTCLNAALDPLVYLFGAEKFRGTVRRMFCRRRREEAAGISAATSGELKGTHESSLSAKSEF